MCLVHCPGRSNFAGEVFAQNVAAGSDLGSGQSDDTFHETLIRFGSARNTLNSTNIFLHQNDLNTITCNTNLRTNLAAIADVWGGNDNPAEHSKDKKNPKHKNVFKSTNPS